MLPVTELIKDIQATGKGNEWIYKIAALLENAPEGSWVLTDNALRAHFTIQKKDGYVSINGGRITNNLTAEFVIKEAMDLYTKYFHEIYERSKTENISLRTPEGHFVCIEPVDSKYKQRAVIDDKLINITNMNKVLKYLSELSDNAYNNVFSERNKSISKSDVLIINEFFNIFMSPYGECHDELPNFIKREPVVHGERNADDKFIINGKTYTQLEVRPNRRVPKEEKDAYTLESIFTSEQAATIRKLVEDYNLDELRTPLKQADFILRHRKNNDGTIGAFSAHRKLLPVHQVFDIEEEF